MIFAASAAAVLVLAISSWVTEASAAEPVPGIRYGSWKRVRDLATSAGSSLKKQKIHVRPGRTYVGPAPTEEQLREYRVQGQCDIFYGFLRDPWKARVDASIRHVNEALDALGDACDAAIDDAKRAIRGTADEFRVEGRTEVDKARQQAFYKAAEDADEMCVYDSYGGVERHYRIRRGEHPRVYELRRQDGEVNLLRQQALHEEIARLLAIHGSAVLDETAMDMRWQSLLAAVER